MAIKMTFSLDEESARRLNRTARRLAKPKSEIVRAAIREYEIRTDKLEPGEQQRMLALIDRYLAHGPTRSRAEAERELKEIQRARRAGGRRHRTYPQT